MGNIFCECNKRDELNFSESNKSLLSKKKSKKKEMKGFSKNLTKIQNWSTLRNSSLIGKGVGDPKEKYTFLDQLSKSETSMLYKVKLKKTGELRSIKIIKKGDHSMSTEKAIITEIELLETIDHPNILKIYEFYYCPENICIIGELGRGGPLSKCIKKIINESETVKAHLMFQLLSTVTYCHAMNIMHRDIKPEHILIEKKSKDGFYYIKLIDFGTAKVFINLNIN